jgi:TonB-linked SusC/RagA family outer membrane protein
MTRLVCLIMLGVAFAPNARPLRAQQATGTVTGRVLDAAAQRPLPDVQVSVVGTQRGGVTNENGEYRIQNVPAGTQTIRAQRIGYAPTTLSITVPTGNNVVANLALSVTAVELDQVVVTATGETQRRRETGNTVAVLQPAPERLAVSSTVSDLLTAQAPGVYVNQSGGTQGTANRIRIRGANSVSLSNEPLILIDGIRTNNDIGGKAGDGTIGVGGQVSSRLNDLNPEDIESVEVLKGPAASAMYGTAASNGVIQIRTKRGRAGKAKWNVFGEGGQQKDTYDYPSNYSQIGTRSDGSRLTGCTLDSQARNLCTPTADSLASFNPLLSFSPFVTGHVTSLGGSVSGGSDVASYFISGDIDQNKGVYAPNHFDRTSLRATVNGQLHSNLTTQVSANYLSSRLRFPQNDNNVLGVFGGGLLGSAFDDPVAHGYIAGQTVQDIFAINTQENVERFIGGTNTTWNVTKWLTATGVAGVDYVDRRNRETVPPNTVFFGSLPDGQRTANTADLWSYSANGSATAAFDLTPTLRSSTTASVQFNKDYVNGVRAFGAKLLAGTGSIQGTSARFAVGETNTDNKTLGGIIQEQIAWKDRLFLSGGIRTDNNSAFGSKFGWITYPSAGLSYVISDESFFPKQDIVSSLRLRTSYGRSGQRPNFRDAITFFNTQTVTIDAVDQPGIVVGGTGNADLRPEVSSEFEGGFEAGFWKERIAFEATYYNKKTNDLLIARPLPPSLGLTTTQFANLGSSVNSGYEFTLRGDVFTTDVAKLSLVVTAAQTRNELTSIGKLQTGDPVPPIISGEQRQVQGFPLGGYWDEPYTFADKNNDGIISRVNCPGQAVVPGGPECEIQVGATAGYLGNPFPTREWSLTPRLTLFNWLQLGALIDHRGGYKVYNLTERFRCNFGNCRAASDKTTPLAAQAANLGQLMNTDAGYIEDGTFTKLREISATLTAPRSVVSKMNAAGATLTIAARNLHTWTNYTGFDPEVNSTPSGNFGTSDFLTQPPLRIWSARVSLSF